MEACNSCCKEPIRHRDRRFGRLAVKGLCLRKLGSLERNGARSQEKGLEERERGAAHSEA